MKSRGLISLLFVALLATANATSFSAARAIMPAGCNRPNHVQRVSITDSSVTLVWQGNADRYEYLCVRQEDMAALNIVSQGLFVNDTTVTLTGLRPGGVYCFRVRGHCGWSVSAWSQDFYFRTLCGSQKLPYSETFEACSGTGVTALPPCWMAYYVINDTAFIQSQATNVFPVTQYAIKGKKSLALKEEAVTGTLMSRKRCYVAMPKFATEDSLVQLSFDAIGMGRDTMRLVIGLVDRIDNIEMMETIDTIVLSSRRQQYDTVLLGWRLTGSHIVFYNIGGVRQPMSDHYTLLIDNVQLRKVAKAEQKPPYCPHPLVMVKKENILEQSALVTWNDVNDRYEVQWKEQTSSKWSKSVSLHTNTYNLTGLKPDTKYMVRVRSVCKANKYSVWSSAGFITKAPAYCPYPYVTVGEDYITEQSALVAWDGENDSYELQWKKESSSAWSKAVSLNGYSYVITGLESETRYIVQVRGMCDGKDYSTWTPASFVTKAHPVEPEPPVVSTPTVVETQQPCPEVENLRVVSVGSDDIQLEWKGRTNAYAFEIVGYDEYHLPRNVIHSEVSLGSAATIPTAEVPQSYSYSLNELTPDKDYEVRIRTRCADGRYGGWSERVSFHTDKGEETLDIPIEEMIEEDEDTVYYTLTEKGVDILQIGKPFVKNPPAGAIYDKVVKTSCITDIEEEITYYELYKDNIFVGEAVLGDRQRLMYFNLSKVDNVALKGEIPNTPIGVLFNKEGVVISPGTINPMNSEGNIIIKYNNSVQIIVQHDALSPKGKAKFRRLLNEQISSFASGSVAPYSVDVQRDDFKPGITIMKYSCSYGDNDGSHEMCDPWSIGSDLEI